MKAHHKKYILENSSSKPAEAIARELGLREREVRRFLEQERPPAEKKSAPASEPAPAAAPSKGLRWAAIALLPLITFIFYANSLHNEFVWDDKLLVEGNPAIAGFSHVKAAFTQDLFKGTDKVTGYYRPVQTVTYMADRRFWGMDSFGYHLTNTLIQSLNAVLVFILLFLVFGDVPRSFLAAAVFAVHPAFVPVTAYISGRADLLGFFFGMTMTVIAVRYLKTGKGKMLLVPAVLSYALAFLSKEYYLATPLFVLAYAFAFRGEIKPGRAGRIFFAGLAAAAGVYALLRATALNFHQDMGGLSQMSFFTRAALVPYNLTRYAGTLLFPTDLTMEKKLVYSSFFEPRFVICYLTLAALAAAFVWARKGRRVEFFFLLWFAVGLAPVINLFFPLKTVFADHWAYTASVGLFALVALFAERAASRWAGARRAGRVLWAVTAALVLLYGARTFVENRHWKNEEAFYAHTAGANPSSSRPVFNMGKVFEERGENEKALERFDRAIEMKPDSAPYHWTRGHLYRKMGKWAKAEEDLLAAVRLEPGSSRYRSDLGALYAQQGKNGRAAEEFKKALEIDPKDELARKNLDVLSGENGA